MRTIRVIPVIALALLTLTGCGVTGAFDHDFMCKGKATIVGSGSGFAGINGTVDCGEGFMLVTGTKGKQEAVKELVK